MENVITLGKLLSLWFCFLLLSILFLKTQTSCLTYKIIEFARPVMGTIFLFEFSCLSGKYMFPHVSKCEFNYEAL